jgi:hypothetical protein
VPCSDGLPDAHEPRKDLGLYLRGAYCCTALSLKGLPDAPGLRKRPIQTPSSILRNTHRKDNDDHPFIDITPKSTPLPARLCCSTVARSRSLSLSEATVCVECLFLRTPIRAPYMTPSACAKRRPTRDPPPRSPPPRIHQTIAAQAAYTEALLPGSASGPNCFQALGSSPGLLQSPIL